MQERKGETERETDRQWLKERERLRNRHKEGEREREICNRENLTVREREREIVDENKAGVSREDAIGYVRGRESVKDDKE